MDRAYSLVSERQWESLLTLCAHRIQNTAGESLVCACASAGRRRILRMLEFTSPSQGEGGCQVCFNLGEEICCDHQPFPTLASGQGTVTAAHTWKWQLGRWESHDHWCPHSTLAREQKSALRTTSLWLQQDGRIVLRSLVWAHPAMHIRGGMWQCDNSVCQSWSMESKE